MRRTTLSLAIALLGLTGCFGPKADTGAADNDGDGLTNAEEAEFGTDLNVADTDGDGLGDLEEYEAGTDGTNPDTDADGYSDYHELLEGKDPTDPESRIYIGNWPYNPDKDAIVGADLSTTIAQGDVIGRLVGPDQFADNVDLYDFAYQGKYILVDVSTGWCSYCMELSKFLTRQDSIFDGYGWDALVDYIEDGTIQWVTILSENAMGGAPTQSVAATWDSRYQHDLIPVIADEAQVMPNHVNVYGYPTVMVLDETMTVVHYDRMDYTSCFDEVLGLVEAR
jgi:thiol-disulfide isomerase/thioredoxin